MLRPLLATLLVSLTAASASAAQSGSAPAAGPARPPAGRDLALDRAARARYVGQYTLADSAGAGDTPLRVYVEGDVLLGQMRANAPTRLLYQGRYEGRDTFRPAAAPDFAVMFTVAGAGPRT